MQTSKISYKLHSPSSSVCEFCFIHNIKCIPHQLQQGKRNDIKRCPKRPLPRKRLHGTNNNSIVSKFSTDDMIYSHQQWILLQRKSDKFPTKLENIKQKIQDQQDMSRPILNHRSLMPRMQGPQHHVAYQLPWIQSPLQKQLF